MKLKINKKNSWILLLLLFLSPGIYQTIRNKIYYDKVKKNGVYSVCKIIKSKGRKGGKVVEVRYKFGGKIYELTYPGNLGKNWIGDSLFIKILPSNPEWFIVLEDSIIPGPCIKTIPLDGWPIWNQIPNCSTSHSSE